MSPIVGPSGPSSDDHHAKNSAFIGFDYWQSLVLCVTLGSGCFALLSLMLARCRHSAFLSLLIITGLVHELYCAAILGHFKILVDSNLITTHRRCVTIYPASLIANGIYLSVILSKTVDINFQERTKALKCMIMLYVAASIALVLSCNFEDDEVNSRPMVIDMMQDVKLYFTVCKRPVHYDTFLSEYIFLYVPIAIGFGFILISKNGIHRRRLCIIDKCQSKNDECCVKCEYLNDLLQTVLIYYTTSLLIIRPLQMVWNWAFEQLTMDIIPSLVNTVMYSYLSLEHLLKLRQMKHIQE